MSDAFCDRLGLIDGIEVKSQSQANFVLVKIDRQAEVIDHLRKQGWVLRELNLDGQPYCRITVGTDEQMNRLATDLAATLGGGLL